MALVEQIQAELRKLLPKEVPSLAKGVVEAPGRGWYRALYYDPVTGAKVAFLEPPTIVAIAELREGTPPKVTAPTISIPTIELPKASPISIPTITLPSASEIKVPAVELPTTPTIEIPVVTIPFLNETFPYFLPGKICFFGICQDINVELADLLNKMVKSLYTMQSKANDVIEAINSGLKKAREAIINVRDALFDFRDKTQKALNEYKDKIQTAVNDGLSDSRTKTQEALNTLTSRIQTSVNNGFADSQTKTQAAFNAYRDKIEASVNAGLSTVIPMLYQSIGLPLDALMSPINIRNVKVDSFEFWSLSAGMKLHYIAISKR